MVGKIILIGLFLMMITNTEMTNWIIEKFSGSDGIRTHDLRVTSPLLYQLRYRALGAVR